MNNNKIDLEKYKRKRTFSGNTKDYRNQCEIISDKPTAIEYMTAFIDDKELSDHIKHTLENDVPEYFWINPSSSSRKYHINDEKSKFGLVLHTCRVVKVMVDLCISAQITGSDRDDLIVAAILHDAIKYGIPGNHHTVSNHPNLVGEHLSISDKVNNLIRTHSGQWFNPGEWADADEHQRLLHQADYIASRSYIHVRIP